MNGRSVIEMVQCICIKKESYFIEDLAKTRCVGARDIYYGSISRVGNTSVVRVVTRYWVSYSYSYTISSVLVVSLH